MKKQILILTVVLLILAACSYEGDSIKINTTTFVEETTAEFKFTPKSEYTNFLSDEMIATIGSNEHSDILGIMEAETVEIKVAYFTPPGWNHKFAYVQINYYMENNSRSSFLFFYPDDNGTLSDDRYSNASIYIEIPCSDCQLTHIEVTKDEKIIGHFKNLWDEAKHIKKTMDYNFREMSISWEK